MTTSIRTKWRHYLETTLDGATEASRRAQLEWRVSCYDTGIRYVRFLESRGIEIRGKVLLDIGAGWGGHAVAFAEHGAEVIASDLNDHRYDALQEFANREGLSITARIGDCATNIPRSSIDVVTAFDVIEHVESDVEFAQMIAAVLKPGGISLITTPPRLRSIIVGEPHFHLRLIAALPFSIQGRVARAVFGRGYPFPITRQYTRSASVLAPFAQFGLTGTPLLGGTVQRLGSVHPLLERTLAQFFWHLVLVERRAVEAPVVVSRPRVRQPSLSNIPRLAT